MNKILNFAKKNILILFFIIFTFLSLIVVYLFMKIETIEQDYTNFISEISNKTINSGTMIGSVDGNINNSFNSSYYIEKLSELSEESLLILSEMAIKKGNYSDAEKILSIKKLEQNWIAKHNLGLIASEFGMYNYSIKFLDESIQLGSTLSEEVKIALMIDNHENYMKILNESMVYCEKGNLNLCSFILSTYNGKLTDVSTVDEIQDLDYTSIQYEEFYTEELIGYIRVDVPHINMGIDRYVYIETTSSVNEVLGTVNFTYYYAWYRKSNIYFKNREFTFITLQ